MKTFGSDIRYKLIILRSLVESNEALTADAIFKNIAHICEINNENCISIAALYVTISRFKKEGYIYVAGNIGSGTKGGKPKNVYKVTDKGCKLYNLQVKNFCTVFGRVQ